MSTVKLTKSEYDYLLNSNIFDANTKKLFLSANVNDKQKYVIRLSEEEANNIHEKLWEEFLKFGITDDDNLTKEGLFIEKLMDVFFDAGGLCP